MGIIEFLHDLGQDLLLRMVLLEQILVKGYQIGGTMVKVTVLKQVELVPK